MIRYFPVLLVAVLSMAPAKAFAQKDRLEGIWFNEEQSAKVQIYKAVDGKFWGKIIWLKEPNRNGKPKLDENNTNKALRTRPELGLPVLQRFKKDDEDTYDDGTIYDPANGKTYSCKITFRNNNELGIRGYVGISLLGRTTTWKRAE